MSPEVLLQKLELLGHLDYNEKAPIFEAKLVQALKRTEQVGLFGYTVKSQRRSPSKEMQCVSY